MVNTIQLSRYHRVDATLWHCIDIILWRMIAKRIDGSTDNLTVKLSLDDCQLLTEFQSQMAFAYIHPRRDSLSLICPSANPFVCLPSTKKNLSL